MSDTQSQPETVTVSRADLAKAQGLNNLLDRLWADPEVGETVRRRAKVLEPSLPIPDDHPVATALRGQLKQTEDALAALRKEYQDDAAARSAKDQESALREQLGLVQEKRGLTDEGMAGVIQLMQDRQIADPDAAALAYLDKLPKTTPQAGANRFFDTRPNLFGSQAQDAAWEKLWTDEPGFFADQVNAVFEEMPPQ